MASFSSKLFPRANSSNFTTVPENGGLVKIVLKLLKKDSLNGTFSFVRGNLLEKFFGESIDFLVGFVLGQSCY
jgi:hypothetical protein